jgi:signal peptidase II
VVAGHGGSYHGHGLGWNSRRGSVVLRAMRHLRWILFLVIVLGVTGCDHATKLIVTSSLNDGQVAHLISGVLSVECAHNQDSAFSLLSNVLPLAPRLLLLKTTATAGALVVTWLALVRFARQTALERVAFALLLGGAVGNAIDRWRWGYVVDFIHVEHWPTFNVADMALSVGAGLWLLSSLRADRSGIVGSR